MTPIEKIHAKLTNIMIGGCTCSTKSPELKHHKEGCHYRLASEIGELLQAPALKPGDKADMYHAGTQLMYSVTVDKMIGSPIDYQERDHA